MRPDLAVGLRNLLAILLVAQGLRVAVTSPVFALRQVEVVGSERLSAAEVRQLAGVQFGVNLFRLNLGAADRNLRTDPIIKSVRLSRLPPSTLRVRVTDRQPALIVRSVGTSWEVDDTGLLYREAGGSDVNLPVLSVPLRELPRPGEKLDPTLWKTVNRCIDLASQEQLVLRGLRFTENREIWLDLELDGEGPQPPELPVRLGRQVDLQPKFRDIRTSVYGWPRLAESSRYLNVMSPGRPVFKSEGDPPKPAR